MRKIDWCLAFAFWAAALVGSPAWAADACCGRHNGLCGCQCCDGVAASAKCLAAHAECRDAAAGARGEAAPMDDTTHFQFTGETKRVADGGNLIIWKDNKQVKVRLAGVACPAHGQPFADAARKFTAAAAAKKEVDVEVVGVDKSGRYIAQVVTPDGKNLNRELLKAGLAWRDYRTAPNDRELDTLQSEALATGAGLWADPDPIPPWDWKRPKKK